MKHLKPKITKRINAGGTTSFCVDAGIVDGKRQRRFFPTKAAAEEHADKVQQARAKHGAMAFSLNKHQQVDAIRALPYYDAKISPTKSRKDSFKRRSLDFCRNRGR